LANVKKRHSEWSVVSKQQSASVVGEGFRVVARAEDQIIEAVERTNPELAVKWHPERSFDTDPASQALSSNSSKKPASTNRNHWRAFRDCV
jgi:gamma-glutamyl-gamma-aminobutyrate hydrolase PuuD